MPSVVARFAWLMPLLAASACASNGVAPVAVWPAAPAVERVRFVRTIGGDDVEPGWRRFWRRLAGMQAGRHVYHPVGIAVSADGSRLFVSDQALGSVFLFDLAKQTFKEAAAGTVEGVPIGLAADGDLGVWVVLSDKKILLSLDNELRIRKRIVLEESDRPTGVAYDAASHELFVSDSSRTGGSGHCVLVYDETGRMLRRLGAPGTAPGQLLFPTFLALRGDEVVVADTLNARVQRLRRDTGQWLATVGTRGDRPGQFDKPKGVAFDSFGNLYVVDSFWSNVQIFNSEGQLLLFFAGRGDSEGFLSNPAGIAIDATNRIYVVNPLNFRIEVYQLVNTQAGDSEPAAVPAG